MIEHDPQVRHFVGDLHDGLEQVDARVGGIEHEIGLRHELHAVDERRVAGLRGHVPPPQVAVADAAEQRVLVVAREHLREVGLVRFEVADDADDDRVAFGHLEDPQVVFDPRARFDLDRADDAERTRERGGSEEAGRVAAVPRLSGPVRDALRPPRIEEVDVRVDDRNRGTRRAGGRLRRAVSRPALSALTAAMPATPVRNARRSRVICRERSARAGNPQFGSRAVKSRVRLCQILTGAWPETVVSQEHQRGDAETRRHPRSWRTDAPRDARRAESGIWKAQAPAELRGACVSRFHSPPQAGRRPAAPSVPLRVLCPSPYSALALLAVSASFRVTPLRRSEVTSRRQARLTASVRTSARAGPAIFRTRQPGSPASRPAC